MGSVIASSVLGFVGGIIGWFATNYWGRTLLRFWDLRLEAHETMFIYANVPAGDPASARAKAGSIRLRWLGVKIDAIRAGLPSPLCWYLHMRKYDLRSAALGLTELSNSLGTTRDSDTAGFECRLREACACRSIQAIERKWSAKNNSRALASKLLLSAA
jgi:hypothetical protein